MLVFSNGDHCLSSLLKTQRWSTLNSKQDKLFMYNVILRRVRITILPCESK